MSDKNLAQALLNILTDEQKAELFAGMNPPESEPEQKKLALTADVKSCAICGLDLPTSCFHGNSAADDGLDSRCARCVKVYKLERDIEKLRDQARPMRNESIELTKLDGFDVVKQFTVKRRV